MNIVETAIMGNQEETLVANKWDNQTFGLAIRGIEINNVNNICIIID